ncbi:hypothetical protein [Sporisorium scitamineum]|uniref:Uncharacterized protein n=1 Tax=Sporisorium scitamineum TaxID=49012 RepID=A0A0F7S2K7_9BASI|nr:hypothetical protein [Sporisorium scitamineum]
MLSRNSDLSTIVLRLPAPRDALLAAILCKSVWLWRRSRSASADAEDHGL